MTQRSLSFDYARAGSSSLGGFSQSDFFGKRWDPYLPQHPTQSKDGIVWTNGVNANTLFKTRRVLSFTGPEFLPLHLPAAHFEIAPTTTGMGAGRIYGQGYVWRFRFKSSTTGDVSGLNPLPDKRWDLGVLTTPGAATTLGQNAYFRIPFSTTGAYAYNLGHADTIQLFRNTTGNEDHFYLVGEGKPASPNTWVDFLDDTTDEELFGRETSDFDPLGRTTVNPSFDEGAIPAFVKSFPHSSGRLVLYGTMPMGPYRAGTVTVTAGSNVVAATDATTVFSRERIGQSFRLRSTSDVATYRIVNVGTTTIVGDTLFVTPPIKTNTSMTSGVLASATYEIVDDRDLRTCQWSEPGAPTNYDVLKQTGIGFDREDGVLSWFGMNGRTFVQTRRHLYALVGDNEGSEEPGLSTVPQLVAAEGAAGFESGCETPFGWCYLHPTKGVRVFDGNGPPRALGSQSPLDPFLPRKQFEGGSGDAFVVQSARTYTGFEPSLISETRMWYDPQEHLLHVFYVPKNSWCLEEELAYDPAVNVWRGPWRRVATAAGMMRNTDGSEVFAFGGDRGELWLDNKADVDHVNGGTGALFTTLQTGDDYVLIVNASTFDSTTFKEEGAPLILTNPTPAGSINTLDRARVIDVISALAVVLDKPVMDNSATRDVRLGAVQWFAKSAHFAPDVTLPQKIEKLRLRFERGDGSASTAAVGLMRDGDETIANLVGQDPNTSETVTPASTSYQDVTLLRNARLFGFVAYGTSITTDPQTTFVVADLEVEEGV